jgi:hypothetical protein
MSVGDILDRGLKILFARLSSFYVISLVTLAPLLAVQLLMPSLFDRLVETPDDPSQLLLSLVLSLVATALVVFTVLLILQPLQTAAILHVIAQEFVDRPVTVGQAFQFAFSRFGSILLVSFLSGLIIVLGSFLCFIPGIIFAVWYVFVGQVVVVENLKGTRALSRSMALTEGYRWRVFGIGLLLVVVIPVILGTATNFLNFVYPATESVPTRMGRQTVMMPRIIYPNYYVHILISYLLNVLAHSYAAVCWTLFYFDLRIRKEGYDLELAAQQPPAVEIVE